MKKLIYIFILVVSLIILASCGSQKQMNDTVPEMLDVNLSINPAKGEVNKPITFKAKVTQGSSVVNDADEVTFEIWRSKNTSHEKITIKNPKDGVYSLHQIFHLEGTYYIISHVTARGLHTMPKKEFTIGHSREGEQSGTGSINK